MRRLVATLLTLTLMTSPVSAQEPVRLYAAGSLRAVLEEIAARFADESGTKVAGASAPRLSNAATQTSSSPTASLRHPPHG